jgi:hypothetical protein
MKGQFGKEGIFKNNTILEWLSNTKSLQYVSYGGQIALSMIIDSAGVVLKAGLGKSIARLGKGMWNGVVNTVAYSVDNKLVNYAFDTKQLGKSIRELKTHDPEAIRRSFGFLDRMIQKTRFQDLGYVEKSDSLLRRGSDFLGRVNDKGTGITILNRCLKETVAEEVYDSLIRECLKGESANRAWLNKMGITESYQKLIAETYEKFGSKNGSLYFLDLNVLRNQDLVNQIRASVQTVTDQTIQAPGMGDVPRFLRSQLGSLIFMFKSYPFLIYNNILRPAFTGKAEDYWVQAMLASIALSVSRKYLYDLVNDSRLPEKQTFDTSGSC